jgi:putative acetyltransferase
MSTITIRRAKHEDAEQIISAHVRSIREVCGKDYTPAQINAWAGRNFKATLWCQAMDRDHVWVAENNLKVVGYAHLAIMSESVGEVMGLYLAPEAIGFGMGKKMFTLIHREALNHGVKKLQLHSTKTARSFYEALGFKQLGEMTSVEIGGAAIPCYEMELHLGP